MLSPWEGRERNKWSMTPNITEKKKRASHGKAPDVMGLVTCLEHEGDIPYKGRSGRKKKKGDKQALRNHAQRTVRRVRKTAP